MAINIEVIQDQTTVEILTGGTQGATGSPGGILFPWQLAGTLTVATNTLRWYAPQALTITRVRASVGTAPTGAAVIVDVNKNGTTIFTTQANRPTIAIGANTALGTPDITALAQNDYLTFDVDQIGSTVAGANLTVQVFAV